MPFILGTGLIDGTVLLTTIKMGRTLQALSISEPKKFMHTTAIHPSSCFFFPSHMPEKSKLKYKSNYFIAKETEKSLLYCDEQELLRKLLFLPTQCSVYTKAELGRSLSCSPFFSELKVMYHTQRSFLKCKLKPQAYRLSPENNSLD